MGRSFLATVSKNRREGAPGSVYPRTIYAAAGPVFSFSLFPSPKVPISTARQQSVLLRDDIMALDWSAVITLLTSFVTWVVQLLFGNVATLLHRLGDKYPNTWFGKWFLARDPPSPLPKELNQLSARLEQRSRLSREKRAGRRRARVAAVQGGNRPLVRAIEALTASIDNDIAQRRQSRTFTATITSP